MLSWLKTWKEGSKFLERFAAYTKFSFSYITLSSMSFLHRFFFPREMLLCSGLTTTATNIQIQWLSKAFKILSLTNGVTFVYNRKTMQWILRRDPLLLKGAKVARQPMSLFFSFWRFTQRLSSFHPAAAINNSISSCHVLFTYPWLQAVKSISSCISEKSCGIFTSRLPEKKLYYDFLEKYLSDIT